MERSQVISIHEYELKPGVGEARFERTFLEAESLGLFELPGLVRYHFVKGIRGVRRGKYAVLWIYESQEAWEQLWGRSISRSPKKNIRKNGPSGKMKFWHRS